MSSQQSRSHSMEELGEYLSYWKCGAIGLPTWILVNGTWSALSGMADKAPEGFAISAYLMLCLSTGNLCPLIMNAYVFRNLSPRGILGVVCLLDIVGLVSGIAMALSWEWTVSISGQRSSLALFLCFLSVGASSSAANVAKYMLVANLSGTHTSHLSTGIALGSMLAGLLGIARGFTSDLGFNVSIFIALLCLAYVPSIAVVITFYRRGYKSQASYGTMHGSTLEDGNTQLLPAGGSKASSDPAVSAQSFRRRSFFCFNANDLNYFSTASSTRNFLLVQALMAGLGFGFVPAVLSTVCAKFRSPYTVLLLATAISCIIDPIGRFITASRSLNSHREVYITASTLGCLAGMLFVLGLLPSNSLYKAEAGGVLPAILYVAFIPIFGFLNTSIFLLMKKEAVSTLMGPDEQKHSVESDLVRLCGIMTQTGAMIGSVSSFVLIFALM